MIIIALASTFLAIQAAAAVNSDVLHTIAEWATLNFTWDAQHSYNAYVSSGMFIPENCALAGINVDIDGSIFLTVPRWRNGVPATLNKYNAESNALTPFPSWDIQREGVDGDLQNVQSMTIDSKRRMWAIEVGRRNFFSKDSTEQVSGAAGIWIIDLVSQDVVFKYSFPESIVSYDAGFLNDIVVDDSRDVAYLTDAWGDGALIAFDLATRSSRRYSGPSTKSDPSYVMIINGVNYGNDIFTTPTDGIALSEDKNALFYCEVQGTTLYRVPTAVLRDFSASDDDISSAVEALGRKEPSDGMTYANGTLFFGSLTTNTIYSLPVSSSSRPNMEIEALPLKPSAELMHWVDTFAKDLSTSSTVLHFVSNRLDQFLVGSMDFTGESGSNFRIVRFNVTAQNHKTKICSLGDCTSSF